jgi:lipopolysaccharide export system permease protein
MLTTFDRHILKRFVLSTALLIAALIVFFIVLHYVEYVDDFMDRGARMREVFLVYYPNYVPEIIKLTTPLALFMSCVYLTGRLAQQLQLAALQTSGVSLQRLLLPYLSAAVVITGFMFWFNGYVVPGTNAVRLDFEERYMKDAPRQIDVNHIHRQERPGTVVTVSYFDRASEVGITASLQRYDSGKRLTERIDAPRMQWIDSLRVWRFQSAVRRKFGADGGETRTMIPVFDTTLTVFPLDFARSEKDVESMTIPVASEYIESLKRAGADNLGQARVQYYSKFSYPLASFILVLIGVPMSAVRRRGGQAIQIGIGLSTAFIYLALIKFIEPFGYTEALSPIVASWLPHGIFLGVGLLVLLGTRK